MRVLERAMNTVASLDGFIETMEFQWPASVPLERHLVDIADSNVSDEYSINHRLPPGFIEFFDGYCHVREATKKGYAVARENLDSIDFQRMGQNTRRGRVGKGVVNTLDTSCLRAVLEGKRIRKITPRECFALQGFDKEDADKLSASGISNSQLYKQAGNSICVAVLEHLFSAMKEQGFFENYAV